MPNYDPDIGECSEDEKILFDCLLQAGDPLTMYILEQCVSPVKWEQLYNSFDPKGRKIGMYKRIVDKLRDRGKWEFEYYVRHFQDGGDISDLSETTQELIKSRAV